MTGHCRSSIVCVVQIKEAAAEYFVFFPFYGSQGTGKLDEGLAVNLYWTNMMRRETQERVSSPLVNWYNSPKSSGGGVSPYMA
jgi:hypothetical protein